MEHLITSQGMRLAIPNRHVFEKAAAWADVVHFMMPSPLGIMGLEAWEKLGIPHTAAFHCQPENITFTLHMGNSRRVNDFVYNRFRDTFFNRFTHPLPQQYDCEPAPPTRLHRPAPRDLQRHQPGVHLRQAGKGTLDAGPLQCADGGPLRRGKKRQDELIDACAKSRHAREIQVILAGKGSAGEKKIPPSGGEAPQSHRHGVL